jgi:hypothetical protein
MIILAFSFSLAIIFNFLTNLSSFMLLKWKKWKMMQVWDNDYLQTWSWEIGDHNFHLFWFVTFTFKVSMFEIVHLLLPSNIKWKQRSSNSIIRKKHLQDIYNVVRFPECVQYVMFHHDCPLICH